jgi:adenosine deaminase
MCQSPLHPFLSALPKCEHHIHIEGSLSPTLLFTLSAKNSIPLPSPAEDAAFTSAETLDARYTQFSSLDDFLAYYYIAMRVLVNVADFADLTQEYLLRAYGEGVRHAEVFFDPQAHLSRGVGIETIVEGLLEGRRRATEEIARKGGKMTVLFIPCLLRHLPVEDSKACFELMESKGYFGKDGKDGVLAGLGLCSSEIALPPGNWKEIFAAAGKKGIRRTVHAGEEGPASYVTAALDELGAVRIDHGVRSAEDDAVLERLAREKVLLSVCPLSNVALKGFKRVADEPIRKFIEKGVRFSVNSDDPAYFGGYILENYCALQAAFGLTVEEWMDVARNSVEGSWCEEERKKEMLNEIEGVYGDWKGKV